MEQEVKDTSPSNPSKMEEIGLGHDLRPISIKEEVAQQEKKLISVSSAYLRNQCFERFKLMKRIW